MAHEARNLAQSVTGEMREGYAKIAADWEKLAKDAEQDSRWTEPHLRATTGEASGFVASAKGGEHRTLAYR